MLAKLKEETYVKEEAEKVKTNLIMEQTAFYKHMDKAKADTMAEFRVSQPFFDVCGAYYGDRFDECLKQVEATYPDLNLSQIIIDNTILPTPGERTPLVMKQRTLSIPSSKRRRTMTLGLSINLHRKARKLLWLRLLWN